ncbi:MAG: hypothetical protein GY796_23370 [Chloroflexi bacterium]|nr:hypothetical protein [Chloroflexota bacterium]
MHMIQTVIAERGSYTFSDYFKLNIETEDILAYFGFSFSVENYVLPHAAVDQKRVQDLTTRLEESLPFISLTNEAARREFLIAPVLAEVVHCTQAKIRVEMPLTVNEQLQGVLDYFLQAGMNLLIVEAKKGDLQNGFTQLAIELVALDKVALDKMKESSEKLLYGAVSMGNVWQFGVLNREAKHVTQDYNLFRVPADLEALLQVLVAILKGDDTRHSTPS